VEEEGLMKYEAKKIYKGLVSVRDYIIEKTIKKGEGLEITFKGKKMTVPLERLEQKFQIHDQKFKSLYNNKSYSLYDFRFKEDVLNSQLTLF